MKYKTKKRIGMFLMLLPVIIALIILFSQLSRDTIIGFGILIGVAALEIMGLHLITDRTEEDD